MKNLHCPQCDIQRFFVKNVDKDTLLVTVTENYEIIPIHEDETLEGFDLTMLFCLGCSWSGSTKSLKNHLKSKRY